MKTASIAALGLAFSAFAPLAATAQDDAAAPSVHRVFDVMREGSKIGTDTFDIARKGDTTHVKIVTHILVKVMFVNAYRYDHSETSAFKGSQLLSFTSKTDDNGTDHTINASQNGAKVSLVVDGEQTEAPRGIVPASLWSADVSAKTQLFDPGNGKRLAPHVQDLGMESVEIHGVPRQLHHIKLSGQFERDLWFDKDGLVKMALRGSDKSLVTSELRASTAEN